MIDHPDEQAAARISSELPDRAAHVALRSLWPRCLHLTPWVIGAGAFAGLTCQRFALAPAWAGLTVGCAFVLLLLTGTLAIAHDEP